MIFFCCKVKAEYYDVHFFDRHNHKLQIEDFELFIALLERLMAEQIRKQSATAEAFNRLLYLANLQKKFQRDDGYLLFVTYLLWYWIIFRYNH